MVNCKMPIKWIEYPNEKKQIKLKYLEFLEVDAKNVRELVTDWALKKFPYLNKPDIQFGGSFDHRTIGFFYKEHGFRVTKTEVHDNAQKMGIGKKEYIDFLRNLIELDKKAPEK